MTTISSTNRHVIESEHGIETGRPVEQAWLFTEARSSLMPEQADLSAEDNFKK